MKATKELDIKLSEIDNAISLVESRLYYCNRTIEGKRIQQAYYRKMWNKYNQDELFEIRSKLIEERKVLRNERNIINKKIRKIVNYYDSFTTYYVNTTTDSIMAAYNEYRNNINY